MDTLGEVQPGEILLRRIPPKLNYTQFVNDSTMATGLAFLPDSGEKCTSVSRLSKTTPLECLQQVLINDPNANLSEWNVAIVYASDAFAQGLEVTCAPNDIDQGHCHILVPEGSAIGKKVWSRLAKHSRILSPEEIESGNIDA